MRQLSLPVSLCHLNCVKCGFPVEFQFFESGGCGDFATFFGRTTQSVYRLDLGQIGYLGKSESDLLAPAIEQEQGANNLLRVPEQLNCRFCGTPVAVKNYAIDSETTINAFLL